MKTSKVGGKINTWRRGEGATVGALARKCHIPESTMEKICLRLQEPSGRTLWALEHYAGMSPDLFDEEDWGEEGLV